MSPYSQGVPMPAPTTIIIFGASGDLTQRKLIPALYTLFAEGRLPEHFAVIGVARSEFGDAELADDDAGLPRPSPAPACASTRASAAADDAAWERVLPRISTTAGATTTTRPPMPRWRAAGRAG